MRHQGSAVGVLNHFYGPAVTVGKGGRGGEMLRISWLIRRVGCLDLERITNPCSETYRSLI